MSQIVRRTYKVSNFTGDNYLKTNELKNLIKPKKQNKIETIRKISPRHKKSKKPSVVISYEEYTLSKIFDKWLEDNMHELIETFNEILGIYYSNHTCVLSKNLDDMFKGYTGMVFRSNVAEIQQDYK